MVNHPNRAAKVTAQHIAVLTMQCEPIFGSAIVFADSVRVKGGAAAVEDELILDLIRCGNALTDLASVLMHDRKIHVQRAELAALKAKVEKV